MHKCVKMIAKHFKQTFYLTGFVRARGGSDIRDVNLNSENWAVVKAALVTGMYPNLVHVNRKTSLISSNREKKVHFHPTSALSASQFKEVWKKIMS